jgi:hypothetical protein
MTQRNQREYGLDRIMSEAFDLLKKRALLVLAIPAVLYGQAVDTWNLPDRLIPANSVANILT